MKPDVIAYTDGGCRGNPGPGAWAFLLIDAASGAALERTGGERHTTNNRMELLAVIEALKALKRTKQRVRLLSDSQYVINSATKWMAGWKAKGWKRKEGELKNVDLLKELDNLIAHHDIEWQWVRGHDGEPGNERVDALTNHGMDRIARGESAAWENRTSWPAGR
ncbi:MAG: ribonuclease HI [bacterium]